MIAITCLLLFLNIAITRQYEVGQTYVYVLKSDVYLNDGSDHLNQKTGRQVGYGLEGKVKLSPIWRDSTNFLNRIVEIDVAESHLVVTPAEKKATSERKKHASNLDNANHYPMYALFKENEIVSVWAKKDDDHTLLNIKKGILSMFQYQVTSEVKSSQVDVSGKCKVSIKAEGATIKKSKEDCDHPDLQQYEHPNPVRSVKIKTSSQTNIQLSPDLSAIQTSSTSESIRMSVNAWPEASIEVIGHHKLKLEQTQRSSAAVSINAIEHETQAVSQLENALKGYARDTIIARPHLVNHATKFKGSLKDRIALFRDQLSEDKLSTLKNPMAFVTLLENFRIASESDVVEALQDPSNAVILSQLLDIAGASQTLAALRGSLLVVDLEKEDTVLSERLLMAVSMASHPDGRFVKEVHSLAMKGVKNPKVFSTLLSSLGSVMRHAIGNNANMKEAHNARQWLEGELMKCKDDICKVMFLRALRNAAQPLSIPTLLGHLRKASKSTGTIALKTLKEIGPEFFTAEVFDALEHVFFESKTRQESTARALAAELIFRSGSQQRIERVMKSIKGLGCPELQTFITNKFRELNEMGCTRESKKVAMNHSITNYDSLAHGGLSATFTRLLARTKDLNTTYGVNMELIPGGLLKQTQFDINVHTSPSEEMPLISVNIFASGLAGIAGGDTTDNEIDDGGEPEETTAGMVLNILGVEMRPYIFFSGRGELMGHVWAGTASEHTPALQGTFLLMDHMQLVPLLNGLIVQLQLKGAVSVDLGGSVQISLWNRNSHSIVHAAGAGLIQGSARLLSGVASAQVEVNVGVETYLDFITDFEFYEKPYKMCIQMTNPGVSIKHNTRKYEDITDKHHLVRTRRRRSSQVGGKSFPLTQKNSELCTAMHAASS